MENLDNKIWQKKWGNHEIFSKEGKSFQQMNRFGIFVQNERYEGNLVRRGKMLCSLHKFGWRMVNCKYCNCNCNCGCNFNCNCVCNCNCY